MPKKSRKNVGLIGLGIIGSRVANALRVGGFHVFVWNRTPRAAPNFLASPRQIAELCDVIQLFVADAQALFDVLEAMGDAVTPSHIIICNATVGPEATLEAARLVNDRGAQFLDAPFSGSLAAAQNRELVYYIGGDDKTLQAVEPVLQASSKAIVKIGKIGDAAVIKVATNMICAVTVQTLAEAYAVVKESGIEPTALAEALRHHGIRSGVADAKLAKMLERDYEPHFSLKHMFKDVQLGIHIANSLDIDLPATTATAGVMYGGLTKGWADQDFAVLGRAYQKDLPPASLPPKPVEKVPEKSAPAIKDTSREIPAAEEKKEPPRDLTADELRNVGIKVSDAPSTPPQPVTDKSTPAEPKPEPPKADNAGAVNTEAPKPETAKPEPLKADATEKDKPSVTPAAPAGNRAHGEPEQQNTPFVRIRRWFGTGSPS
jgi:3-hydroxyisobutyrate dehydrogenase-like beta-hydroxyacid dehydrogenase